jgi:hypothetical protein
MKTTLYRLSDDEFFIKDRFPLLMLDEEKTEGNRFKKSD